MKPDSSYRHVAAPRALTLTVFICSLGVAQFSYAQNSAEFADDFSVNSILYRTGSFNESPGSVSATVVDNAIVLTAQQIEGTDFSNALFKHSMTQTRSSLLRRLTLPQI